MIRAGHCTGCHTLIWRTTVQQREMNKVQPGAVHLLWPMPSSVYARYETPSGYAPGIPFCSGCAPATGAEPPDVTVNGMPSTLGPCLDVETAHERYAFWYTQQFGDHMKAWLVDQVALDEIGVKHLMTMWEQDRRWAASGLLIVGAPVMDSCSPEEKSA